MKIITINFNCFGGIHVLKLCHLSNKIFMSSFSQNFVIIDKPSKLFCNDVQSKIPSYEKLASLYNLVGKKSPGNENTTEEDHVPATTCMEQSWEEGRQVVE